MSLPVISDFKVIIGLGNPGNEYTQTRHNAGFLWLDELRLATDSPSEWRKKDFYDECQIRFSEQTIHLIKPNTFMNNSGIAVSAVAKFLRIELDQLLVIYDDLDIDLGKWKLQFAKSPKQHNGVSSIVSHLKSDQFWHLRLGVDNRDEANRPAGLDYVLKRFPVIEMPIFQTVIKESLNELGINNGTN